MNIENEFIINFINYDSNIPHSKTIQANLGMLLMTGIPSTIWGVQSNITKLFLAPILIVTFWAIYLLINKNRKKEHYVLFMGLSSFFISISFMLGAYKIASLIWNISLLYITITILLFLVNILLNFFNVIRLIKKDAYKQRDKGFNPLSLFMATSLLGIFWGKSFIGVKQDMIISIMVSLLIFMAFLYSVGILNLLKYYFIKSVFKPHNSNNIRS